MVFGMTRYFIRRAKARKEINHQTRGANMNNEKELQWVTTLARVGDLSEELRILRQSKGITAGEKKAISALIDKLGRFKLYGLNCCTEGGAR